MRRGWLLAVTMLVAVVANSAHAETLILHDGSRLDGEIISRDSESIAVNTTSGKVVVNINEVSEIVVPLRAGKTRPYDFTRLSSGDVLIALAKVKSDHENRNQCVKDCSDETSGDLGWDVACSDYCDCLWKTDNTKEKCKGEFKDTTGKDPPFALPPQEATCGACLPKVTMVKTCTKPNGLGQNEDLVVTVACNQPMNFNCSACFEVIPFTETCCVGSTCETRYCSPVSPIGGSRP